MSATIVKGPWSRKPIEQPAHKARTQWWKRDHHGNLWVWTSAMHKWHRAPVPMAESGGQVIPTTPPDPAQITRALDMAGLDGPEVDEALGVADAFDTVVDAWEAGTLIPSSEDVRRLAFLTGLLPAWFYRPTDAAPMMGFICGRDGCRPLEHEGPDPCPHCAGTGEATP